MFETRRGSGPAEMQSVFVKICGITNIEDAAWAIEVGADALGFNFWPRSPRYIRPEAAAGIIERLKAAAARAGRLPLLAGVFVDAPATEITGTVDSTGLDLAQIHGELPSGMILQSRDRKGADASACRPNVDTNVDAADMNVRATNGAATAGSGGVLQSRGCGAADAPMGPMFEGQSALSTRDRVDCPQPLPFWHALSAGPDLETRVRAAFAAGAQAVLVDTPSGAQRGGTGRVFDWSLVRGLPGRIVLAGGLSPENVAQAIRAARPWGVDACSRLESAPGRKDPAKVRAFVRAVREMEIQNG